MGPPHETGFGGPPTIRADDLTFRPAGRDGPTPLRALDFGVAPGDLLLVAGPTGSGKSTLLALLAGLGDRFPDPQVGGRLQVVFPGDNGAFGHDAVPRPRPGRVAWVRQEPGDGLVAFDAFGAVAMPLEESGRPPGETLRRVEEALARFDVLHLAARPIATLSAGEKRRVALAGVDALDPGLVLLDEPLAGLDPWGVRAVIRDLHRLRERRTVVVAEHRVEQVRPLADQVLHLIPERAPPTTQALPLAAPPAGGTTITASDLLVRRGDRTLVAGAHLRLSPGAWGLLGPNGAGKTSLLDTLAGLTAPAAGSVQIGDHPVWADARRPRRDERGLRRTLAVDGPDPKDTFFAADVADEVAAPRHALGLAGRADATGAAHAMLREAGLSDLAPRPPLHLSGGEARRVQMLASLLIAPSVWFLDEPTHGLDPSSRATLAATITAFAKARGTVVVATHEPDLLPTDARWLFLPGDGRVLTGEDARPGAREPRAAGYLEDARA